MQRQGPAMLFHFSRRFLARLLAMLLTTVALAFSQQPARKPQRIVSTAPSITETLFALGLGKRVVGVTDYCHYPPEANTKARIGQLLNPNIEAIVALHPDLVIVEKIPNHLQEQLARLGIPSILVAHDTVEDVLQSDIAIARAAGEPEAGYRLNQHIQESFRRVREETAHAPRLNTVFVISHTPGKLADFFVAGRETYLSEILVIAGARNAFDDAKGRYPEISLEEILVRNPDAIIEMVEPAKEQALLHLWAAEPKLTAVRNRHVYGVPAELFEVPSPRLVEAVDYLVHVLHPELGK